MCAELNLMVIDDDSFFVRTLRAALNTMGFSAVADTATVSEAIIELSLARRPVDILFCDLTLPHMDGIELMRLLADIEFTGAVILVSGAAISTLQLAEGLGRARGLYMLGVLHKPVAIRDLKVLLDSYRSERRRVCVESIELTPSSGSAWLSVDQLRAAIREQQIVPFYQPIIDLRTGDVSAVEALARWRHPVRGLVAPGLFIPLAEESDLIGDLTDILLQVALEQLVQWLRDGYSLAVAFNVSVRSLAAPEFVELLCDRIASSMVDTRRVKIEVTESRLANDSLELCDSLLRLRLRGVQLSIDDFGIGYSSLSRLRDWPFDELKIDRSFVQSAGCDSRAHSILLSSIELGRRLHMRVTAEGVETIDDWQRVVTLGCDQAQGYFIAKPMPADELPKWVRMWRQRYADLAHAELLEN